MTVLRSLPAGPVRVVAGAGTGKTAVIADRFRKLVEAGSSPESILVMTFTDRAAGEMRQRIEAAFAGVAPSVGTFHSIALAWLREDGRSIGVPPGFRLVTGADRWILARELMWSLGDLALTGDERPDDLVAPVLQMLERMKEELVPIGRLAAWAAGRAHGVLAHGSADDRDRAALMRACVRLFRAYERECRTRRLVDFDDLLLLAVRMLEQRPAVLARYRARYRHVLVDEYQDLNLAQERLVELVASGGDPFIVGDDDQSIYRFRGASRASLERFLHTFPNATTVALGRNRRSSRRIVAAARALIEHNRDRLTKELRSDSPGEPVQIWDCADAVAEATGIAREATGLIAKGVRPESIAVLCRTNAITRPIASALAQAGLPHVVIGGHGLFDRKEIRDVIAMLRAVQDPDDLVALARPAAAAVRVVLHQLVAVAREADVRDLFFELMERSRYLVANPAAAPDVSRFGERIAEFCEGSPDHSLAAFMRYLDMVILSGEDDYESTQQEAAESIQVMTIHQSKGLEFDVVFVPSLVEGRLPQPGRSPRFELPATVLEPLVRGREDVVAEERRLLYVAMTRARRRLYLSWAEHYEGGRRWRPSRFLDEIRQAGPRAVREVHLDAAPETSAAAGARVESRDGPVRLSYSAMTAYLDCPRQYWYRHVERLPVAQSAEAAHGEILHEVLRRAGELRKDGKPLTAGALKSMHEEVWRSVSFPDPRRAPAFRRIGAAELEAYRRRGGLDAEPVYLEQPFDVAVDGWQLRGVIDRIDRAGDGWRIIDYKSGRPVVRRRRDLQVALYALGASAALKLEPLQLEVVYLASDESRRVDRVGELVREAEAEGAEVAAGIRAGRFESRPERRRCRLCPYRLACEDAL